MSVVDIRSRRVERLGRPATGEASGRRPRCVRVVPGGATGTTMPGSRCVEATSGLATRSIPMTWTPQSGYVGGLAWTAGRTVVRGVGARRTTPWSSSTRRAARRPRSCARGVDTNLFAYQDLAWSPDGSKLAYDTIFDDGHQSVFVVDRDGGQPVELGSISLALPEARHLGRQLLPAWSPDGAWVAFKMDAGIFLARPDGSRPARPPDRTGRTVQLVERRFGDHIRRASLGSTTAAASCPGSRSPTARSAGSGSAATCRSRSSTSGRPPTRALRRRARPQTAARRPRRRPPSRARRRALSSCRSCRSSRRRPSPRQSTRTGSSPRPWATRRSDSGAANRSGST